MKVIWIFVLILSSEIPTICMKGDVKGFAGGGVIIICKFNKFKDREKYFCKKAVNTDDKCPFENLSSKKDGRYSQYYNTSSATLHVHLTKLNLTDSGLYQFGTQNKNDKQSVSLSVNKDDCCGQTISVCDHVGGSVGITCTYPEESANNSKHFCKFESRVSTCSDLIASKRDETRGRFSIAHNRDQHLFSVTMRELTSSDSGVYWCGVRTWGMSGSLSLIKEVKLEVKDECPEPSPSISTQAPFPEIAVSEPLTRQPVIIMCVGAAVVVVATVVFVYLKCRRFKSLCLASTSSTDSRRETGNKTAPHTDCDYEEIKDTSSDPNPESSRSCISNPPDSVYTLVQLPSEIS